MMNRIRQSLRTVGWLTLAMCCGTAIRSGAVDWRGDLLPAAPGNGNYSFNTPGMWSGGTTPNGTTVVFRGDTPTASNKIPDGSVFTVYLENSTTNLSNHWNAGHFEVTYDLAGFTDTRTNDTAGATKIEGRAQVGEDGDPGYVPVGHVTVNLISSEAGGTANWAVLGVGYANRAQGAAFLNVSGANTTLNITYNAADRFRIGSAAIGTMTVSSGATVTSATALSTGHNAGANGTLIVTGPNSSVSIESYALIGAGGTGALTVSDGGFFQTIGSGSYLRFASSAGSQSTGLVEGRDSRVTAGGYLSIGGVATAHTGDRVAHVTVRDGGILESGIETRVFHSSTLSVEGHGVTSGAGGDPDIVGPAVKAGTYLLAYGGSTLAFRLSNPEETAALVSTGTYVQLNDGAQLGLSLADDYTFTPGDSFKLISYATTLTGTFAGLANSGDTINVGGNVFEIDYGTGMNSAITVTAIPEPGVAGLLISAFGLLALWRRTAR